MKKGFPLVLITSYLIITVNCLSSNDETKFSFDKFDKEAEHNFNLQTDASYVDNTVQLTRVQDGTPLQNSVGRILYATPVRIYDSNARKVAQITTEFTFRITSGGGQPADGLAFLIAPPNSNTPAGSYGGLLGLFSSGNNDNSGVVAVEFDTFQNPEFEDPPYSHVGIDVNSIVSKVTSPWNWNSGETIHVKISYSPYEKELVVEFDGSSLSYPIDLTELFGTDTVKVGFSAATGNLVAKHNLLSWSFQSELVQVSEEGFGRIASVVDM